MFRLPRRSEYDGAVPAVKLGLGGQQGRLAAAPNISEQQRLQTAGWSLDAVGWSRLRVERSVWGGRGATFDGATGALLPVAIDDVAFGTN